MKNKITKQVEEIMDARSISITMRDIEMVADTIYANVSEMGLEDEREIQHLVFGNVMYYISEVM